MLVPPPAPLAPPAPVTGAQIPEEQLPDGQTVEHTPQLSGSVIVLAQLAPQTVVPPGHVAMHCEFEQNGVVLGHA